MKTYLCLVAQAIGTIDPDVLCEDLTLLVQAHVLGQVRRVGHVDIVFGHVGGCMSIDQGTLKG